MGCPGMHCGGCRSGGGLLVSLVVVAGVVLVSVAGYRTADAALSGVAASAAAVNQMAAWVAAVVVVVMVLTGGGWLLLGRYRTVRDAPIEAAFRAQVQAALTARDQVTRTAIAVDGSGVAAPLRVPARVVGVGPRNAASDGWRAS